MGVKGVIIFVTDLFYNLPLSEFNPLPGDKGASKKHKLLKRPASCLKNQKAMRC